MQCIFSDHLYVCKQLIFSLRQAIPSMDIKSKKLNCSSLGCKCWELRARNYNGKAVTGAAACSFFMCPPALPLSLHTTKSHHFLLQYYFQDYFALLSLSYFCPFKNKNSSKFSMDKSVPYSSLFLQGD